MKGMSEWPNTGYFSGQCELTLRLTGAGSVCVCWGSWDGVHMVEKIMLTF